MSLGTPEALRYLRRDAVLKRVIRQVGPFTLKPARRQPYEALVRAIAHQQVHGRAAEAILGRFIALCPGPDFPAPDAVLALTPDAMRGAGLSANKVLAIRDIAEKAALGVIPNRAAARRLSDEALIERLVALRGVGRWTVEMFMMFQLGRLDVWPTGDLAVRRGWDMIHGSKEETSAKVLDLKGEKLRPYRSVFAWYCYQAIHESRGLDY